MKMKWRALIFCGVAAMVAGCAQLGYFMQAAQGQLTLLSEARPIDDWLASPDVEDKLKGKLTRVKQIRAFAARELSLPDNGTFTTYADLSRKPEVHELIAHWVDEVNRDLARPEQVKRFTLIEKELDHEDGELTATLKVKRRALEERFSRQIEELYV